VSNKRVRTRLARSELWIELACKTEQWAKDIEGTGLTKPFDEWPHNDPFRVIAATYELSGADLVRLLRSLGAQCEAHAMHSGFEEAWR
jgi:hypothetical protein